MSAGTSDVAVSGAVPDVAPRRGGMLAGRGSALAAALIFSALAVLPPIAIAIGAPFLVVTATRIVVFAIAALSLDLVLGYGAMVSFGHAAFVGLGAYAVAILSSHGISDILVQGVVAVAASALFALVTGAISLRTKGVYFIMITLSFGQMLFFLFVSLEQYGGDDGMMMFDGRNTLPFLNLNDRITFYYVCLACLVLFFWFCHRLVRSKFGRALAAIRQNEDRLSSIGIRPYTAKLLIFVIAGAGAGLAGALSANHTEFVSPALTHWTRSGDLMIVVILGGIGTLTGPVLGTFLFLLLEEFLPLLLHSIGLDLLSEHWRFVLGPILILIVLFAKTGLYGLIFRRDP